MCDTHREERSKDQKYIVETLHLQIRIKKNNYNDNNSWGFPAH